MIEVKLSQGAKPGHGGILPAAKLTPEIVEIRGVVPGEDVISPPAHTAFTTPIGLLQFLQQLREASGGKPVGFKLCVGKRHEFFGIVQGDAGVAGSCPTSSPSTAARAAPARRRWSSPIRSARR